MSSIDDVLARIGDVVYSGCRLHDSLSNACDQCRFSGGISACALRVALNGKDVLLERGLLGNIMSEFPCWLLKVLPSCEKCVFFYGKESSCDLFRLLSSWGVLNRPVEEDRKDRIDRVLEGL